MRPGIEVCETRAYFSVLLYIMSVNTGRARRVFIGQHEALWSTAKRDFGQLPRGTLGAGVLASLSAEDAKVTG